MNRIALLVVYLGEIPNYIRLFLKSCEYQEYIDFIFFTDWDWTKLPPLSNNVKINTINTRFFNKLASQKSGLNIEIKKGYKLCDIKPAWPHIFEDYLREYEFVGWCDIDLVLGDVNSFFSESLKVKYDLLTVTTDYVSGALTIIRNTRTMRLLYQKAKGWKQMFQDDRHFAFDELLRVKEKNFESFSDVVKRLNNNSFRALFMNVAYESRPDLVIWDRGIVRVKNDEYVFFHYVVAKQSIFFVIPAWVIIPDKYYVNKWGFYRENERQLNFISLFFNVGYIKQIVQGLKKKRKTIIKMIKNNDFRRVIKTIIKQFK